MFDIGFWELAILFGLGLIVLGPEKLPRVANQLGNWAGQARRMARNLSAQMRSELDAAENAIKDPLDLNKPASGSTSKGPTAADTNKVAPDQEQPAWQTSAGLRPGYSSVDEIASGESADSEAADEEHPEYDPFADPDSVINKDEPKKEG